MFRIDKGRFTVNAGRLRKRLEQVEARLGPRGTVCIKLLTEEETRRLNHKFRHRSAVTDVLSFPINEKFPDGFYLGDIGICMARARTQARANGLSIERELLTLAVHGLLHLYGHDHERDSGHMLVLQEKLVQETLTSRP